ncbi:MAG: bifunctional adenosylcobinamide kinase/adenosylcobinamide-phosphate guanylyltransferase [Actinomycetota bacterium]|nr:bifunctional adenosylcobinamide kinase/adenosylcobinamide-phosphate guanylyltransferase [Actinomycetota bacterium]
MCGGSAPRAVTPDGSTSPAFPPFPLTLPVAGRRVVVVGGGAPAARVVTGLRAAGADISVVAPEVGAALADLASRGLITARRGGYQAADLDGAWLVLACTGRPEVDAAVAADAERSRLWCVPVTGPPRRVLVLGGARSGKSATAESLLAGCERVQVVTPGAVPGAGEPGAGEPGAGEPARADPAGGGRSLRPGWRRTRTLDLAPVLRSADPAPVLVDSLSDWLDRVLDERAAGVGPAAGGAGLAERLDELLLAWRESGRQVVAVSGEVGSGVVPATAAGRLFRDELGRLNARIAAESDEVWLCTAGVPQRIR